MPHAVIVVGNERRFIDNVRAFAAHLRSASAAFARIATIRGAYLTPKQLRAQLRREISLVPKDDALVIAYFGHGIDGAWSYALEHQRKPLQLSYRELAADLARHPGPLAILNDCCHAASLETRLEQTGIPKERCMLISACAADAVSTGASPDVLAQWRDGKTFEPVHDREEITVFDKWHYTPTLRERAGLWWHNAKIRFRNLFRSRRRKQPTAIRLFSPPNGWGMRQEIREQTIGRRWGTAFDHLFFPRPV